MEYKEITREAIALVEKSSKVEPLVRELQALYQTLQRTEESGKFTITANGVNVTVTPKQEMFKRILEITTAGTWEKIDQLEKEVWVIMNPKYAVEAKAIAEA